MQQIYDKKNELFEVEFYKNEECTEAFDFTNSKNIYINGEFDLQATNCVIESGSENAQIFIPYIPQDCINSIMSAIISRNCDNEEPDDYDDVKVFTLTQIEKMWDEDKIEGITPNLSKYIPEDNAVLFLSEEDMEKYQHCFPNNHIGLYINDGKNDETFIANNTESLINGIVEVKKGKATIFLSHGTKSEIKKAEEVAKHLWKNFGIKPDVFVFHCFLKYIDFTRSSYLCDLGFENKWNINKIITTNSTGILKPEDSTERLQVIDCKEIFEKYLKENNF